MVHVVNILLIMSLFKQAVTGSKFSQFDSPEKADKNKMLMYFRGLLKPNSLTTSSTAKAIKQLVTVAPASLTIEELWDGKNLPDRTDKSKMLAYLRGMRAPNSISRVQEPQHGGMVQILENAENKQTIGIQNPVIDMSEYPKDPDRQVVWATTDPVTMQRAKEGDSDTCFWRGQQSQPHQHKLDGGLGEGRRLMLLDQDKERDKDKEDIVVAGFDNLGENIRKYFQCLKTKFWKSYYKVSARICAVFDG